MLWILVRIVEGWMQSALWPLVFHSWRSRYCYTIRALELLHEKLYFCFYAYILILFASWGFSEENQTCTTSWKFVIAARYGGPEFTTLEAAFFLCLMPCALHPTALKLSDEAHVTPPSRLYVVGDWSTYFQERLGPWLKFKMLCIPIYRVRRVQVSVLEFCL